MSYRHNFLVLYETFIIEVPSLLDVLVGWALNLHSLTHIYIGTIGISISK